MRHPAESVLNALTFHPERPITMTPERFGLDYEDLWVTAADGARINAWFVRAERPIGHVLYAHGNAGNIGGRSPVLALLAAAGLDVLTFDYRGYGRSSGRPHERGLYLDARAARRALLERPGVDPERVVYLGKSLGGGVLTELAVTHPPAAMVLMSTFTGLRAVGHAVYPFIPKMLVPDAFPSERRIRSVHAPVFVMHGDADELVPVEMGRALHAAAPGPKRLLIYPGAGHNTLITIPGWSGTVAGWVREVLTAAEPIPGE
ncbi:alpha/beta hydrolase [Nocardia vermiculata]|uniref:Alpha/beta hydrolase n=1 Tax=Nocardia vermiculata TaxID=257274 RepID=A0A846Y288_9NOCA|nr:alpha/beta hydrolase [Nocardia vermiculata]NKY52957.1 alpha/beta hydrolase [Nocardia vermiculata]